MVELFPEEPATLLKESIIAVILKLFSFVIKNSIMGNYVYD